MLKLSTIRSAEAVEDPEAAIGFLQPGLLGNSKTWLVVSNTKGKKKDHRNLNWVYLLEDFKIYNFWISFHLVGEMKF